MLCSFLRGSRLEEDIGTTMGGGVVVCLSLNEFSLGTLNNTTPDIF